MSNCANCEKNDGMCYTSIPPKYKCTIDNSFHDGMYRCNLYDKGYQKGRTDAIDDVINFFKKEFDKKNDSKRNFALSIVINENIYEVLEDLKEKK